MTTKLGTHNSLSYGRPLRWWQYPLNIASKCQRYRLAQQYQDGVEVYDIRVRFSADGTPYACHGLVAYQVDVLEELAWLAERTKADKRTTYVRVLLEDAPLKRWDTPEQMLAFYDFCKLIDKAHGEVLHLYGGWSKSAWRKSIYPFPGEAPTVVERHASVSGVQLAWLCPWLWARNNNYGQYIVGRAHREPYIMMDFYEEAEQ